MEENNTRDLQPEELSGLTPDIPAPIPEDMPQLDLDAFGEDTTDTPPLENLFPEQPESLPVIPSEPAAEEFVQEELVLPEDEGFIPSAEPASSEEAPAEEPIPLIVPEILPEAEGEEREFSDFDIPMDDAAPVEAEAAPVYPIGEDSFTADAPAAAAGIPADELLFVPDAPADVEFTSTALDPAVAEPAIETAFDNAPEFAEMPESSPAAPKAAPVRKGRPRRIKGDTLFGLPSLLATLVWLAIIVMIGVSLGRMLWVCAADVLAFGRESKEVVITIDKDDTIDDIAQMLQDKGLIRYPGVFRLYASIAVDEGDIAPGTYTLNTILDYHALVGQMSPSSSSRAVVEDVLIPEGYNCRQIFELLEQNGICTVEELEEYAANGEFQDFWFLEGVERGDKYCLEGYLFPDTYDFYAGSTPREAIGKMLLGFEARFTQELYDQLPALNERLSEMMRGNGCSQAFIDSHQLGLRELLTVASLIEEETAGASESPSIASVIYNRLTQDQEHERYLGIDAAIIYATGDAEHIDTSIDHPYNTYKHAGLTPGPISNPGLSSINAALNFLDTDYYYYVLNPSTGEHQFSRTYEEHQQWIEKFREVEPTEG